MSSDRDGNPYERVRLEDRVWKALFKVRKRMFSRDTSCKRNDHCHDEDNYDDKWSCESLEDLENICKRTFHPEIGPIFEGSLRGPGFAIVRRPPSYQFLPRIFSDISIYGRVLPADFPVMLEQAMTQQGSKEACCVFVGDKLPMGVAVLNQSLTNCEPSVPTTSRYIKSSTHRKEDLAFKDHKKFIGPFLYKHFEEKIREKLEVYGPLKQFQIIEDTVLEHPIACFAYLDVGLTMELPMMLEGSKTISRLMTDRGSAVRMQVNSVIWEHAEVLETETCKDHKWDIDELEEFSADSLEEEVDEFMQRLSNQHELLKRRPKQQLAPFRPDSRPSSPKKPRLAKIIEEMMLENICNENHAVAQASGRPTDFVTIM